MLTHTPSRFAVTFVLGAVLAPCAFGQYPITPKKSLPQQRPAISPYLNLLRRDNSAAFNYFTLVRPELQIRSQLYQQSADTYQLRGQVAAQQAATQQQSVTTGHPSSYLNYSHYYPGMTGRNRAGGR